MAERAAPPASPGRWSPAALGVGSRAVAPLRYWRAASCTPGTSKVEFPWGNCRELSHLSHGFWYKNVGHVDFYENLWKCAVDLAWSHSDFCWFMVAAINCQYHPIPVCFLDFGEFGAKDFIEKMENKIQNWKKRPVLKIHKTHSHLGSWDPTACNFSKCWK